MIDELLLLLRTSAGLVVAGFGLQKLFHWFPLEIKDQDVGGLAAQATFRSAIGLAQIIAGTLLALGVWPLGAALTLAMAGAAFASRRWGCALWGQYGRALPVALAAVAVSVVFTTGGSYSVAELYVDETGASSGGRPDVSGAGSVGADAFCEHAALRAIAERPDGHALCTHGADPAGEVGALVSGRDSATVPPAPCPEGGVSGNRVQVLYGVPEGATSNHSRMVKTVRKKVAYADYYLNKSSGAADQHVRWLCNRRGKVAVKNIKTIAVPDAYTTDRNGNCVLQQPGDTKFTFQDMVCSLRNQVQAGLGKVNFDRPDRIYIVFMDKLGDSYGSYCGQGSLQSDDRPGAENWNNEGPAYSLIACWDGEVTLHELGHNLGAVQASAPHTSGGFHCFDANDAMCYDDGGSYFSGGGSLLALCPKAKWWQFDCGSDDYYDAVEPTVPYLSSSWNVANSSFLTRP